GGRVSPAVKVDALDEGGVQYRRAEENMEQERQPDPVEEVPDVAWGRASDEKVGKSRSHRRDTRHGFDRAERIRESARQLLGFRARHRGGAGLWLLAAHCYLSGYVRLALGRRDRTALPGRFRFLVQPSRLRRVGWSRALGFYRARARLDAFGEIHD